MQANQEEALDRADPRGWRQNEHHSAVQKVRAVRFRLLKVTDRIL